MKRNNWPRRAFLGAFALFLPLLVQAEAADWNGWLTAQIQQHPDVLAAREQLLGSQANADAAEQPLYNPELSGDVERSGEETSYRIGVQQTIDWWDKRGAKQQQAGYLRSAAEALYRQHVLEKTAEALSALVAWQAASQAGIIAQAQKEQLDTLLDLVEKRQRAGDLGSIDAEFTFLSLAQQLAQVAEAEADQQRAESVVRELLPGWNPERGGIPADFWQPTSHMTTDQELLQHPAVASAQASWQSLKEEAVLTRRAARAEPTVGINAGRDGSENAVGLTLSIPLNVRNSFSAETRAAERAALEAEARFQAIYRKQRFNLQAAQAAWQRFDQHYRRWQTLVQARVENSADLLDRQWRSGDLSTTDYLLALNQRAESLLAGIALEKQTRLALTDVLLQSGRLPTDSAPSTHTKN